MFFISNLNEKFNSFLEKKFPALTWWQKSFLKNSFFSFSCFLLFLIPLLILSGLNLILPSVSTFLSGNSLIFSVWSFIIMAIVIVTMLLSGIEFLILFPGILLTYSFYSIWSNWANFIIIPLVSFIFWGFIGILAELVLGKIENRKLKIILLAIGFAILLFLGFLILAALLGPQ